MKLKFTLILEVSGCFLGQWMYKRIAEACREISVRRWSLVLVLAPLTCARPLFLES